MGQEGPVHPRLAADDGCVGTELTNDLLVTTSPLLTTAGTALSGSVYDRLVMEPLDPAIIRTAAYLDRATDLHGRYRAGQIRVNVPDGLADAERPLDDVVAECLPASHAALHAASRGLFFSLPAAFDA